MALGHGHGHGHGNGNGNGNGSDSGASQPPAPTLQLLCAGAAQGLVTALEPAFTAAAGATLQARFGAVGALQEALLAGAPCDVMVSTSAMLATLAAAGHVRAAGPAASAATVAELGSVRTAIAVCSGAPLPAVDTPAALRAALLAADVIFFPDALRSTAGIHFAKLLQQLGIADAVAARCRTFANGATAMRALADSARHGAIGCTQVTEILSTPGTQLVGALPPALGLATVYAAAVATRAADAALAARFMALLSGPDARGLRQRAGFDC